MFETERYNYKDIARICRVSVATISRVINRKEPHKVGERKRKRVERVIQKLGFVPNAIARGLSSRKTYNIAVAVRSLNEIMNPYLSRVISGIGEVLQREGYYLQLTTLNSHGNMPHLPHYKNSIREKRVDGLCLLGQETEDEEIISLWKSGFPLVLIDKKVARGKIPSVLIDNEEGAYRAAKELVKLKHRRIAFMYAFMELPYEQERLAGYRRALREGGIRFDGDLVVRGTFDFRKDGETMKKLLELNPRPSAVFASDDRLAIGVISAAKENALSVPSDISVIGFNAVYLEFTTPPLSSMGLPMKKIGETAARMLLDVIRMKKLERDRVTFIPELVGRGSIGYFRNGN